MQRARAANRRHLKSFLGRHDFWILADKFVQLRRRVHLFPKIQIVVRSRAVCAQTDRQIIFQHLRNRRRT